MQIIPAKKSWLPVTSHAPNTRTFDCARPLKPGWHSVELQALNDEARALITSPLPVFLQQNNNLQGVEVRPVSSNRCILVFFRHSALKTLSIQWPSEAVPFINATFKIKVRSIKAHSAWLHMMHQVSHYHRKQGQSWQYIYRITRARIKRMGHAEALRKLVREYQPLLSHQLISCEPYSYWQDNFEQALPEEPQHTQQVDFILMVRSGDEERLTRTLKSIKKQLYPHWQAYVDSDNLPAEFQDHPQISLVSPQKTDTQPESWYWVIESGDELSSKSLSKLAWSITENSKKATPLKQAAKIVYTDHDYSNGLGQRSAPCFKPDWNQDYYYAYDYIGNASLYHGSLLQHIIFDNNIPWWRQHTPDLRVACISLINKRSRDWQIMHLDEVLYHQWIMNKNENHSEHAVIGLLAHDNEIIAELKNCGAVHCIEHQIQDPAPLVSLLIPTRDALEITRICVDSVLAKTSYPAYEIIILDNQSSDPATLGWFKDIAKHPKVRVLEYNHPFNYSAINNYGATHAKGSIIGLLNNDTEVINAEWLGNMVQHAAREDIGCVGAKLYYFDDTVQHAGVVVGLYGIAGHAHKNVRRLDSGYMHRLQSVQNYSAVTAACLLVRKSVYEEVDGLNEEDLTVAFNDVDFCLKVQSAGYRNLWTPYAELYHYESKTRGSDNTPTKIARARKEGDYMRSHWGHVIAHDPAYNQNLTRMREDFGIRLER